MIGIRKVLAKCEPELDKLIAVLSNLTLSQSKGFNLSDFYPYPIFVTWKQIVLNGKKTKVPFDANDSSAKGSSTDSSTWGPWQKANRSVRRHLSKGGVGGVGVILGVHRQLNLVLVGFDLDSIMPEGSDEILPLAREVLERFWTRSEISPSGLGLKLYAYMSLEDLPELKKLVGLTGAGKPRSRVTFARGDHEEFAFDWKARFYAVTDNLLEKYPSQIMPISLEDVRWFLQSAGPRYLDQGTAPRRKQKDRSGSGAAFRFVLAQFYAGSSSDEALEALTENDNDAGAWAARTDERQLERVLENAYAFYERHQGAHADFENNPDLVADHPVTARLNLSHALVVISGKTAIATFSPNGNVHFGSDRDLHLRYSNDLIPTADGKKVEPASKQWLQDHQRRTYHNGVGFFPGGVVPPGTLNLWTGWATFPDRSASCDLFLRHLEDVICDGNREQFDYLVGYLAHSLQYPEEKPGVALVIKGKKGAGKDTVEEYLGHLFGERYVRPVSQAEHVTGKFNSRLENSFFLSVQEAFWAGDHRAEGVLKNLITSPRIEIEHKGVNSFSMRSVLRVMITANDDWVVPASADERRYAVFEASDSRINDKPYFDALRAEMEGDGPDALHHFLLAHDISRFNVRLPPLTPGLFKQKLESLKNIERWWFDALSIGSVGHHAIEHWESGPIQIHREELYKIYEAWMRSRPHQGSVMLAHVFGSKLRKLCNIDDPRPSKDGERHWDYGIPLLSNARAQFEKNMKLKLDWNQ